MHSLLTTKLVLPCVLGTLLSTMALAATPTAYLERSKVIATGKQIRVYSVPTKNGDGTFDSWDITITIPVLDNGKPDASGVVVKVTPPPAPPTITFVPGTYKADGIPCTLVTSPFGGARKRSSPVPAEATR